MPVVSNITNAQLAQKISDLVNSWRTFMGQLQTWLAGTVGGGPNSDGTYPLTDSLGNTYSIESPAQLAADVTTIVGNATDQATAAAASATAAAASDTAASTKATNAAASAATASTKATNASTAASLAGSYAAAAGTYATNAAASAASIVGDAAATHADRLLADADVTAAASSATAASASASAAAASAVLAATFNPALYAALAGATFTGAVVVEGAGNFGVDSPSVQTYIQYSQSGTILAYTGVALAAGSLVADSAADDVVIRAQAGGIRFTTDSGATSALSLAHTTGAAVFASTVAASNLSGTNTGDQNLAPYALLSGAHFTGAVGIGNAPDSELMVLGPNGCSLRIDYSGIVGNNYYDAAQHNFRTIAGTVLHTLTAAAATFSVPITGANLSGTNTGDQNLAPYALLAGATFSGAISATNFSGSHSGSSSGTNTGDQVLPKIVSVAFTGTGTPTISGSVNAGAPTIALNAAGDYTITWAPGFTPTAVSFAQNTAGTSLIIVRVVSLSSTSIRIQTPAASSGSLVNSGSTIYLMAQ